MSTLVRCRMFPLETTALSICRGDAAYSALVFCLSSRQVPFAGWGMQCCGFVFLDRKWAKDKVSTGVNLHASAPADTGHYLCA